MSTESFGQNFTFSFRFSQLSSRLTPPSFLTTDSSNSVRRIFARGERKKRRCFSICWFQRYAARRESITIEVKQEKYCAI